MEETKKAQHALVDLAVEGDAEALQKLISEIQDKVFNLSLRMLGTIPDAYLFWAQCFGSTALQQVKYWI